MKRKILAMSIAMMTGLPHASFAKSGDNDVRGLSYPSWDGDFVPHYGSEGAAHPLMDHLQAADYKNQEADPNRWRMNFSLPRADLMGGEDPAQGKGARAGVSLKLDF